MLWHRKGVTLIEVLLVTVIVSVVALSVYAAFNNGIVLWARMSGDVYQEDINVFFSRIAHDLRNTFRHSGIEFFGAEESVAFAVPIRSRIPEEIGGIGRAGYFFDEETNTINRFQADYSQLYLGERIPARQLVDGVRSVNFQYYCYDPQRETYLWVDAWEEEQVPLDVKTSERLPLAVKIEVEVAGYDRNEKFTKIVTIPAAR